MAKKKSSRSKSIYVFVAIVVIIIAIGVFYFSQNFSKSNPNQKILDDISNLLTLSNTRSLTAVDINSLKNDVGNDPVANFYVDSAIWFANHNIQTHIGHSLGDLYNYYFYGKDQVCVPHVVEHIGDFIKYNDSSLINPSLNEINRGYADWYQNALANEQKFPATYSNFNQLSVMINATLQNIQQGNYLPTLDNITYITQYDYEGCVVTS